MSARRYVSASVLAVILAGLATASSPATFGGANGRISFAKGLDGPPEIFSANPDGSDVQRLTHSPKLGAGVIISDWSPDGELIAYDTDVDVDGRRRSEQVWVMNADGSGATQLTRGPGFHGLPGWSPDGARMAIDSDWGEKDLEGIWVIPSSGVDGVTINEAVQIVDTPKAADFDSEPQYSPDGQTIIFTRFKAPDRTAIWRVGIDGTGLDRLTKYKLNASDPDYSPDGTKIVYDSGDAGQPGSKGDIWAMHADGSRERRLTDTPPVGPNPETEFTLAQNPVWSPNGKRIMFTQFLPKLTQLAVMKANGSHRKVVISTHKFINKVDWGVHP
jgi:Tol biopolymer transport system component